MSFETLKQESAGLPEAKRKELIGFLLSLNREAREQEMLAREMTSKMNCKDQSRWMTLEEVKARYANAPNADGE